LILTILAKFKLHEKKFLFLIISVNIGVKVCLFKAVSSAIFSFFQEYNAEILLEKKMHSPREAGSS